jgi:hypothetical protein
MSATKWTTKQVRRAHGTGAGGGGSLDEPYAALSAPDLADGLGALARSFDFDRLLQLTDGV